MTPAGVALVLLSAAMHAAWNLMVREQGAGASFVRITVGIILVGIIPTAAAEFAGTPILAATWAFAALSGAFEAAYYLGLAKAYGSGDFTLVYPAVRGLPVLFVAVADVVRGSAPSDWGWVGLALVVVGCLLLPHRSWREIRWAHYVRWTNVWVLVAALGTAGYSIVDSLAAHRMAAGLETAFQYNVWVMVFTLAFLWPSLRLLGTAPAPGGWRAWAGAAAAALFLFGGYTLVLWAYQLSANASYVLAVRQMSIVMGVIAGALIFHEPAARLRITAAILVTAGVIAVGLAR